ncbi:phosphate:acyl-[acyl carrier protein] acyltransferase [Natranaerovirga hydrolytica]|uniref:Phosphate acyltransferase n=1 Tax=Natranaerovirga hydrolytica TaxID=680378 RepID=A0A4R1N2S8_9FIRM|nr:phosphate acyltransferase PlsX [Natranaerovirga hydrolytica]TCK98314.1 phosphate:acyl-[acyl carrier protein] acyltransferase [Natranaerovirga hydrolytica]
MDNMTNIALDAMGGDNAPQAMVKGALDALDHSKDIKIFLVGKKELINKELEQYTYDKTRLEIVHANEVIDTDESPVMAIRKKKDSSLVQGLQLVKDKKVEAFVSSGNTGAVLAGGTFIVGRIKGIDRPALAPLIPTKKGVSLLIDCGANVDAKPSYLVQFAKMGSIYMENVLGIEQPKIGLINIGEEETKGNTLTKETYPLLKEEPIHFVGNVEAREIPSGKADVLVCDAFVGNILLKYTEGLGLTLFGFVKEAIMTNMKSKIGGVLLKKPLKAMAKRFDYTEYGGAPLLGLEGLVVKAHGSADAKVIKNTILQCKKFSNMKINEKIKEKI